MGQIRATVIQNRGRYSPIFWKDYTRGEKMGYGINHIFNDMLQGFDTTRFRPLSQEAGRINPDIDISENEREFLLTAELPAMDESDIEITLTEDQLTIKGNKKSDQSSDKTDHHIAERAFGTFERSFYLPTEIDSHKTSASFKQGVLCITLPKTVDPKKLTKKIKINRA